jgi:hypothetical protein
MSYKSRGCREEGALQVFPIMADLLHTMRKLRHWNLSMVRNTRQRCPIPEGCAAESRICLCTIRAIMYNALF